MTRPRPAHLARCALRIALVVLTLVSALVCHEALSASTVSDTVPAVAVSVCPDGDGHDGACVTAAGAVAAAPT
ncbi:MAG: hypothetical protein ACRDXB_01070, partial [Actinomycetes bacterium]